MNCTPYSTREARELKRIVRDNDIGALRSLIADGLDVDADVFDGDTWLAPLDLAAIGSNIDVIFYLLSHGANLNTAKEDDIPYYPLIKLLSNGVDEKTVCEIARRGEVDLDLIREHIIDGFDPLKEVRDYKRLYHILTYE